MTIVDAARATASSAPFAALNLRGRQVLFAASTGGHLAQAIKISDSIGVAPDSVIVTFRSPQSERLTAGRRVVYVPYVSPRDYRGVARTMSVIRQLLRTERFDAVMSTGAGVALGTIPLAAARGIRAIYIESFSRYDGPSRTGRILRRTPRVETYTQHAEWADRRWIYAGDVAPTITNPFAVQPPSVAKPLDRPPRLFVTLGTIRPYRFDALLDTVCEVMPDPCEIIWQVGCTSRTDLPGRVVSMMPADEFADVARAADVVISHGGVGTAMGLLELGKRPVLVPRRAARGEHVDDHQIQVCRDFAARGLAWYREVDDLQRADLVLPARG